MPAPDLVIDTDRLNLRPFVKNDIEAITEYHMLPEVQRYLDWKARDRVECKGALEALCQQVALHRQGDTLSLAVELKSDKKLIGHVSLRWHDAISGQGEMRFVFNPDFRGEGYATEAVSAMMGLAFNQFKLHRVFARCDARNQPSVRLMRNLGMRLEAHYVEHALFKGEWDEEMHFALLDREWQRKSKVVAFPINRVA